jgi:hypothetical protein
MKKLLIGLSGVVILSLAVVLLVSAQGKTDDVKKAQTEMSKDCSACPSASTCTDATATKETTAAKSSCPSGASATTPPCAAKTAETAAAAPCCASKAVPKTN